jgi:osmoprotectant transport system permease protein
MGLVMAAGGPVLPNFSSSTDKCQVNNGFFCWHWFTQHWGSTFEPALLQHIVLVLIAVAVGFVIAFGLALLAYRVRWLESPIAGISSLLYTCRSAA